MTPKRGYSRAFRPHADTGKRYLLDAIPAELWSSVRAKARRDGVSVRALILHLVTLWVNGTIALPARVPAVEDAPNGIRHRGIDDATGAHASGVSPEGQADGGDDTRIREGSQQRA